MSNRLNILKESLVKKQANFDLKFQSHLDDVKSANGQPLNDKRNGHKTLSRWDRQDESLRNLNASIKKTEAAIDREESKLAYVSMFDVPKCLVDFLAAGKITQWKKHPNFFFVNGVEKARIHVLDDGTIAHRYIKEIPSQEQYAIFRDVFNAAMQIQRDATMQRIPLSPNEQEEVLDVS